MAEIRAIEEILVELRTLDLLVAVRVEKKQCKIKRKVVDNADGSPEID